MYTVIVIVILVFLLLLIPSKLVMFFDASDMMLSIGIPAVRFLSISFFVSAFSIVFAAIFQGFLKSNYSMKLAFLRQVILLIPILLIGKWLDQITVVWLSFVMAEVLSIPYAVYLYRNIKAKELGIN